MNEESNPNTQPEESSSETATQAPETPKEENVKESKKSNRLLIAIVLILIVAVIILVYFLLHKKEEPQDGRATFVSEDNVDEVRKMLDEGATDTYYQASMSVDWYFDNGKAVSTGAYVENTTENTRTVYFDVNLESGELVYSSPYIPVGERLEELSLEKDLAAGDYPATVTYHLVDDEHKEVTSVAVTITIHVLN